jgi:hypothetical protein
VAPPAGSSSPVVATLQLDSGSHLSGTISGFHLGEAIDFRGLAFSSSSSTLSWKQTTSGANASGTLTVKEGTTSTTLTLVGSYTVSNFSATSDGHGGPLPKIARPEQRHEHTTTIPSRQPNDPRQHAR